MLNLHGEPNKVELDVQVSPAGKMDGPHRAGLGGKSAQAAECPSPLPPTGTLQLPRAGFVCLFFFFEVFCFEKIYRGSHFRSAKCIPQYGPSVTSIPGTLVPQQLPQRRPLPLDSWG